MMKIYSTIYLCDSFINSHLDCIRSCRLLPVLSLCSKPQCYQRTDYW